MKKVGEAKSGEKIKIENLNFIINTFAVVNESRGKLYELLLVLQKNPSLKIEIQGHLCCMPFDRADLSTQRAKALYNFLLNQNISKDRLSYKGFGSSQPIYALPEKNEQERAANRRVEIFILEN
jgi:outer membrane protein OmpA-like peptidoglycan-associated protein